MGEVKERNHSRNSSSAICEANTDVWENGVKSLYNRQSGRAPHDLEDAYTRSPLSSMSPLSSFEISLSANSLTSKPWTRWRSEFQHFKTVALKNLVIARITTEGKVEWLQTF